MTEAPPVVTADRAPEGLSYRVARPDELEERKRSEELAKQRGEVKDVAWGSQIRSYVMHPYTMVKDHRTEHEVGDVQRVLDGDLDEFVRDYLNKTAAASAN